MRLKADNTPESPSRLINTVQRIKKPRVSGAQYKAIREYWILDLWTNFILA
jgi:hypothetical protein